MMNWKTSTGGMLLWGNPLPAGAIASGAICTTLEFAADW
jgi:hypothetical protein